MKARLFARVEPTHKSKIIEYLQGEGEVSNEKPSVCSCSPNTPILLQMASAVAYM
jgi:hypothetical protein